MAERRPQQQTLSIRVSEALRDYLEGARLVLSKTSGETVSTSEVAKLLLESAMGEGLDHRFEAADLHRDVTQSLGAIRRKWQLEHPLTHAEWLVLARYVQFGCEERCPNPCLPGAESFVQILMAFLAVLSLRVGRGIELDRYYLGNLGCTGGTGRRIDPELVPEAAERLISQLRRCDTGAERPIFAGRSLYVALRDEQLPGPIAINVALKPFQATLFRLAARGHWLRKHQPILRAQASTAGSLILPTIGRDGIRIEAFVSAGDLQINIHFERKNVTYELENYAAIRDFAAMLERLEPGTLWDGGEFLGFAVGLGTGSERFSFCRRGSGTKILFKPEEWHILRDSFVRVLGLNEIQPVLADLSLAYGEI
jgi:hypothetical protein